MTIPSGKPLAVQLQEGTSRGVQSTHNLIVREGGKFLPPSPQNKLMYFKPKPSVTGTSPKHAPPPSHPHMHLLLNMHLPKHAPPPIHACKHKDP